MRQKQILYLATIILMIFFGCKKSSTSPDLATPSSGTYSGTWVVVGTGSTYGTVQVVKVSNTSVNLIMTAGGTNLPTIPGAKLTDAGSGTKNVSYTDSSGTLTGTITGNTISITLVAGSIQETFTGTK